MDTGFSSHRLASKSFLAVRFDGSRAQAESIARHCYSLTVQDVDGRIALVSSLQNRPAFEGDWIVRDFIESFFTLSDVWFHALFGEVD